MIGTVLFVSARTYINTSIWQLYGLYMRNNKLVGPPTLSTTIQSVSCSVLLMLPPDSTAIMLYRGAYDVWFDVGSDAIHYGNNDFSGAFVRSMSYAALAEYPARASI